MRLILPIAVVLSIAVLGGCSGGDGATTTSEPRVPGPTDTVVVYERVGGIAGVHQRLDVRPDGAARITTGVVKPESKRFTLSPGKLDGLRAARERVDFSKLEKSYSPPQVIADGVASTVRAGGREVTVFTEGDPPPELARLIAVCAGIVDQHG